MNKEELKIGNIITYDGVIATVKCLHYNYLTLAFNVGGEEVLSDVKYDKCAGLPLSPAILEKCGFEKVKGKEDIYRLEQLQLYHGLRSTMCYTRYNADEYCYLGVTITTVHQLQNLFFSLYQYELQIKL